MHSNYKKEPLISGRKLYLLKRSQGRKFSLNEPGWFLATSTGAMAEMALRLVLLTCWLFRQEPLMIWPVKWEVSTHLLLQQEPLLRWLDEEPDDLLGVDTSRALTTPSSSSSSSSSSTSTIPTLLMEASLRLPVFFVPHSSSSSSVGLNQGCLRMAAILILLDGRTDRHPRIKS